jgi:hypothetical protein
LIEDAFEQEIAGMLAEPFPLGRAAFTYKVTLAIGLGIIVPESRKPFEALSEIRNKLAHGRCEPEDWKRSRSPSRKKATSPPSRWTSRNFAEPRSSRLAVPRNRCGVTGVPFLFHDRPPTPGLSATSVFPQRFAPAFSSTGNLVVKGSTMMKRRNRLCRAGLVLAPLVLAAIVTGVAASATNTAIPKRLIGRWESGNGTVMVVGPRGKVNISKAMINKAGWYHTKFSRVTGHRVSISGPRSCSGTGTYAWGFHTGFGAWLFFTKIHDACKQRVNLLTSDDHWTGGSLGN